MVFLSLKHQQLIGLSGLLPSMQLLNFLVVMLLKFPHIHSDRFKLVYQHCLHIASY